MKANGLAAAVFGMIVLWVGVLVAKGNEPLTPIPEVTIWHGPNCPHCDEFAPTVDQLTMDSPAPVQAGPDGKYPIPEPGIKRQKEY